MWLFGPNPCIFKPTLIMIDIDIDNIYGGYNFTIIHNKKGELWVFGRKDYGQLGLGKNYGNVYKSILLLCDNTILKISCGKHHTLILKNNGEIWGFGHNIYS